MTPDGTGANLVVSGAALVLHVFRARPVWQGLPALERHRVRPRRGDPSRSRAGVVENAQLPHPWLLAALVASASGARPSSLSEALPESHADRTRGDRLTTDPLGV